MTGGISQKIQPIVPKYNVESYSVAPKSCIKFENEDGEAGVVGDGLEVGFGGVALGFVGEEGLAEVGGDVFEVLFVEVHFWVVFGCGAGFSG